MTKLNGQFDEISTKTAGLDTSFSQMADSLYEANPQILSGVDGVTGSLNQGGSQMGKAFTDVSGTIGTAGYSMGNTITNLASKLASAGGNFSSLFGVGGVINVGSGFAGDGLDLGSGSASSCFHMGGIVACNSKQSGTADSSL